jgi:hypothetical protein
MEQESGQPPSWRKDIDRQPGRVGMAPPAWEVELPVVRDMNHSGCGNSHTAP